MAKKKNTQIEETQLESKEVLNNRETYVKSAAFSEGKLIIVNEKDEIITLDFTKIASTATMNSVISAVKDIGKVCSNNVDKIDEIKKSLKDIPRGKEESNVEVIGTDPGVVHKFGNEPISGTKYFRRLKVSEFNTGTYNGATMSFNSLGNGNDFINIFGDQGQVSIHIQRDPIDPFEVATKQYVDKLSGTNQEERIKKLEEEIEVLKEIINQFRR